MSDCFAAQVQDGQCGTGSCRLADCSIVTMEHNTPANWMPIQRTAYCKPAMMLVAVPQE